MGIFFVVVKRGAAGGMFVAHLFGGNDEGAAMASASVDASCFGRNC